VRLLLDANLSPEVARLLKEVQHDVIHVSEVGLLSAPDPEIMEAAAQEGRVLLTADSDFGALLALGSRAAPSVVLLRSADHLRPVEQAELLIANLPPISEDLEKGAIVSLTRDRLRVRELPIAADQSGSSSEPLPQ
jgi:predicted nuclease of predicted toxin-antitoxin system